MRLVAEDAGASLERLDRLALAELGADRRLDDAARADLIARLSEGAQTLGSLLAASEPGQRERTVATVAWLAKYGVVALLEGGTGT